MGNGNTTHVSIVMPHSLHARLVRQLARETAARGRQITTSELMRWALEDYLDMNEGATIIVDGVRHEPPAPQGPQAPIQAPDPEPKEA